MGAALAGCRRSETDLVQQGLARLRRGDDGGALRLLGRAAYAAPDDAEARCNLGIAQLNLGWTKAAETSFAKAAELSDDPRPLEYLGQALALENRWDKALDAFRRAAERAGGAPRAQTWLAVAEARNGMTEAAAARLDRVARANPDYAPAFYQMALLARARGDTATADRLLRRFLAAARSRDNARPAEEEARLKAVARARRLLSEIPPPAVAAPPAPPATPPPVAVAPPPALPAPTAAPPAAVSVPPPPSAPVAPVAAPPAPPVTPPPAAVPAAAVAPPPVAPAPTAAPPATVSAPPAPGPAASTPEADRRKAVQISAQAMARKNGGDTEGAIALYKKALRLDPTLSAASFNLGLACWEQRRLDEAQLAFSAAVRQQPGMVKGHYMLAVVYHDRKAPDKAIQHLRTATGLDPDFANAHYLLGVVCKEQRQYRQARTHLRRYIELAPDAPAAANARKWLMTMPAM